MLSACVTANATTGEQNAYAELCSSGAAEVSIIREPAEVSNINRSTKSILCIVPGDYSSAGAIKITSSGIKDKPRYLVYYDPDSMDHANNRKTVEQKYGNRAVISGLVFKSARNWIIDGITLITSADNIQPLIYFPAGSKSNSIVFKNMLLEGGGGGAGQVYIGNDNDNISLVSSVLRNTRPIAHKDSHCIKINGSSRNVISKNEIYNCAGDGIQISHDGSPGTKITDNDIYLTRQIYSDCKGNPDSDGNCACAENAVDIKGATKSPDPAPPGEWLTISGNRMWGFKRTDVLCGGSGDAGNAIVIHYDPSDYIMISDNIIHHSHNGITVSSYNSKGSPDGTDHVSIINNTFYSIHDLKNKGSALNLGKASRYEAYFNTIIDTDQYITMGKKPGSWNEFMCNVLINAGASSGAWGKTSIVNLNSYYNSEVNKFDKNYIYFSDVAHAKNTQLCFDQRRLTARETFCIPDALTTDESPHKRQCTVSNATLRRNIGVDDRMINEYHKTNNSF